MAATQEEIVAGLADIVNEIAGIPVEDVQLDKSFTDDLDVDSPRSASTSRSPTRTSRTSRRSVTRPSTSLSTRPDLEAVACPATRRWRR
jgi:hypothetical protein